MGNMTVITVNGSLQSLKAVLAEAAIGLSGQETLHAMGKAFLNFAGDPAMLQQQSWRVYHH